MYFHHLLILLKARIDTRVQVGDNRIKYCSFVNKKSILNQPSQTESTIVLDFEDTGLSPNNGEQIIEIEVVLLRDQKIVARFQSCGVRSDSSTGTRFGMGWLETRQSEYQS